MAIEREPMSRIDQVAEHFGVSVSTVRHWMRVKKIPPHTFIKIGRTYRFKIQSIERSFFEQTEESAVEGEQSDSNQIVEQLNLDFNEEGEDQ